MAREGTDEIHLLHVDDELSVAEMTEDFLKREDDRFSVETATSAKEGLDHLGEHEVDCIISDYKMPGLDGLEFLEAVRAEYPQLPFILFTGRGNEKVASEAISARVTEYIRKGIGTDQYAVLANRIKNTVRQRRAEHETKRAKPRLQELTESTTDCRWMFSSDWNELLYISGYQDVWDRPASTIKTNPQEFVNTVHPDDRQSVRRAMERLSDGDPFDIEYRILRGNDTMGWVWTKGNPIFDDQGNVLQVVGLTRDITERKERERELERKSERMEFILRSFDAGVWEYDHETGALTNFPEPCPIFGTEFDCLDAFFEKIQPADRRQLEAAVQRAVEKGNDASVRVALIEDAEPAWLEIDLRPVFDSDGEVSELVGLIRDITDYKHHETRLESLNVTTQKLVAADTREEVAEIGAEAASDILDLHANGIHHYDDDQSALVPVAATDTCRELVSDLPTFTGGDSIAWRAYENGETVALDDVHDDADIYNPDSPVRSELHLPLGEHGILIACSDESKAFTQHDIVLGEILASSIATALEQVEQTEQLRERKRELTHQNDRLEEFASVVSHDLRNPLRVAEGRLELAQEECESEQLDTIEQALSRMDVLIEDLLTLAREGDRTQELEPVDLSALSEEAWQTAETAEATLEAGTSQTIQADEGQLKQLLENLIRNAVEHGGDSVTITIGDTEDGFYIADDGPGITPDERDAIFNAGYSTSDTGTGFGLRIVEQVAEAHGWEVGVAESESGGARFAIST